LPADPRCDSRDGAEVRGRIAEDRVCTLQHNLHRGIADIFTSRSDRASHGAAPTHARSGEPLHKRLRRGQIEASSSRASHSRSPHARVGAPTARPDGQALARPVPRQANSQSPLRISALPIKWFGDGLPHAYQGHGYGCGRRDSAIAGRRSDNSKIYIPENWHLLSDNCKSDQPAARVSVFFRNNPQARCTQRTLRPLSRIRAELAGEFSLAIRRGFIYESTKERSC
jgi:hypothetical protein